MKFELPNEIRQELDKPLVLVGGVMAIALVILQFIVIPWITWRNEVYESIDQQKKNTRPLSVLLDASNDISARKIELKKREQVVESWLFKADKDKLKIQLQSIVEKLAADNELKIHSWGIKTGIDGTELWEAQMDIRGEGPLNGLEQFVYQLESYEKLLIIRKFEMQKSFSRVEDKLSFKAKITTYSEHKGDK